MNKFKFETAAGDPVQIEFFDRMKICTTKAFLIGAKTAHPDEFGRGYDAQKGSGQFYCRDRVWERSAEKADAAKLRYNLSFDDFAAIATILENNLTIGTCHWCD